MTIRGRVKGGVVYPEQPLPVPDGTEVTIEVAGSDLLADMDPNLAKLAGILPEDLDAREAYYRSRAEKHK
jgi:hypothetical protein